MLFKSFLKLRRIANHFLFNDFILSDFDLQFLSEVVFKKILVFRTGRVTCSGAASVRLAW